MTGFGPSTEILHSVWLVPWVWVDRYGSVWSATERAGDETADVEPLQCQVDDQTRDHGDNDTGLQRADIEDVEGRVPDVDQHHRQRVFGTVVEEDQRCEVLVPRGQKREQSDRDDAREDDARGHVPQRAERGAAIDERGLLQFPG